MKKNENEQQNSFEFKGLEAEINDYVSMDY